MAPIPEKTDVGAKFRTTPPPAQWRVVVAGAAIALAALAAYHNSFDAPFHLDDIVAIVDNPTIRRLWPIGEVLSPPHENGPTVGGRPLVNLSLAINYALGGKAVWGYHAFNLLIHGAAGLVLFGLVRRTMQRPVLAGRFGTVALPLGLAVGALWTLHPLLTESVTYIVQRAESLMGLFYLLTLYCFVRSIDSLRPRVWRAGSLAACLLGMATKEVMVSAPLMVFLYDRTFAAGTFREAWHRRRPFYLGLAGTWILLAYVVADTGGDRGGTVGFNSGMSAGTYALTQCRAVVQYLRLALWPHPLVFDYGAATVKSPVEVWPQALLLIALVVGTVVALWRRPAWGFLGVWFFAILAPSSSFLPLPYQTLAEHRMYLSLAAVIVPAVAGLYAWLGRRSWWLFAAVALVSGALTRQRNEDYRSEMALWSATLARQPDNERAYASLGNAYADNGQYPEAIALFEQALRRRPDYTMAHQNLGNAYQKTGRWPEAIAQFEQALQLEPGSIDAHNNLGYAYGKTGRWLEAMTQYQQALELQPGDATAHNGLGTAFMTMGRAIEGMDHFEQALRSKPNYAEAERNLGLALVTTGRTFDAIAHFEQAARLKPDYAEAELYWAIALTDTNRFPEAEPHFEKATTLDPGSVDTHNSYGDALARAGRLTGAVAQFEEVLRLNPDHAVAHLSLARALRQLGRTQEAESHYREALRLNPSLPAGK